MFVYCGNNPVVYFDPLGNYYTALDIDDGGISKSSLYEFIGSGGNGTGSNSDIWDMFVQSMQDAASGLSMASGHKYTGNPEKHHILSNKHSKYTPQYQEILERNDMMLNQRENIVELTGHHGRHSNAYHDLMLNALITVEEISCGNQEEFYKGFMLIVDFVKENPWLPYAK